MTWSIIDLTSPPVGVSKASSEAIRKLPAKMELASGKATSELSEEL